MKRTILPVAVFLLMLLGVPALAAIPDQPQSTGSSKEEENG